ncbi:MAG: AMIN domain-containing protein [Gemmatimonas sp.]
MMGTSTVALIAAALTGVAVNANMPGIGSHTHPVRLAILSDSNPAIRGQVSAVSVVAGAAGPEVRVAVDPAVTYSHFTLQSPNRVVVDFAGAEVAMRARAYDGVSRGPVRNVRISQFRADTVRLVIDLDAAHKYTVARDGANINLVVDAPHAQFASWEMGSRTTTVAAAPKAVEHKAEPPHDAHAEVKAEAKADAHAPAAKEAHAPVLHKGEAAGKLEEPKHEGAKAEPKHEAPAHEVAKAEPKHEVAKVEPKHEVAKVEPKHEEPKHEEVKHEAPAKVEAKVEPKHEAPKAEPTHTDAPAKVEVPAAAPTAPAPAPRRQQAQQKPRISIDFDGTDIRDVIATFAKFSGRTIIAGKDVQGTVTANINDKPWDIALQAILSGQGLAATEDASGILTVDSYRNLASNQSLEPLVTRILDVNYAKASKLESTVQKLLARDCTGMSTMATGRELGMNTQGQQGQGNQGMQGQGCVVRGSVAADSATNKLIITEVPSRLPEIIARLQELDIRTPQVAIKAKIVFVNRTGVMDLGLAYDLGKGNEQFFQQLVPRIDPSTTRPIDTNGDGVPDAQGGGTAFEGPARIALGGKALSGIANAGNAIKPNALNLIYSATLGKYQLTTFLNALSTSSLADVQSEPSVTILNNRTATIFVGQEIPIRVIDASAGGGAQGGGGGGGGANSQPNAASFFPRATVTKEEAGIKLTVTPQITNNKMVLLDMIAENSSAELANTDIGVVFNRQKAQSQVLVADGEAAVIGGLTVTEKNKFRSGIPFLMNLPYIGRIFSQNSTTETKRDLLILVTPHILEDGVTPPPGR